MFLFARVLPLVRMLAILNHIVGVRAQQSLKKGYFVDAESVRKTLWKFLTCYTGEMNHDYVSS